MWIYSLNHSKHHAENTFVSRPFKTYLSSEGFGFKIILIFSMTVQIDVSIRTTSKIFQLPGGCDAVIVNALVVAGDQVLTNAFVAETNALCLFMTTKRNIKLVNVLQSAQKD